MPAYHHQKRRLATVVYLGSQLREKREKVKVKLGINNLGVAIDPKCISIGRLKHGTQRKTFSANGSIHISHYFFFAPRLQRRIGGGVGGPKDQVRILNGGVSGSS